MKAVIYSKIDITYIIIYKCKNKIYYSTNKFYNLKPDYTFNILKHIIANAFLLRRII